MFANFAPQFPEKQSRNRRRWRILCSFGRPPRRRTLKTNMIHTEERPSSSCSVHELLKLQRQAFVLRMSRLIPIACFAAAAAWGLILEGNVSAATATPTPTPRATLRHTPTPPHRPTP